MRQGERSWRNRDGWGWGHRSLTKDHSSFGIRNSTHQGNPPKGRFSLFSGWQKWSLLNRRDTLQTHGTKVKYESDLTWRLSGNNRCMVYRSLRVHYFVVVVPYWLYVLTQGYTSTVLPVVNVIDEPFLFVFSTQSDYIWLYLFLRVHDRLRCRKNWVTLLSSGRIDVVVIPTTVVFRWGLDVFPLDFTILRYTEVESVIMSVFLKERTRVRSRCLQTCSWTDTQRSNVGTYTPTWDRGRTLRRWSSDTNKLPCPYNP